MFFFFNDTATTEIYTLSLHDALPILRSASRLILTLAVALALGACSDPQRSPTEDRKSTRLNSSHGYISYAVFCLKKKKTKNELSPGTTAMSACKDTSTAQHRQP